jgi:hypothetical protein
MTISLSNPYTNRKAILNPEDFFGRERETRDIYARTVKGESVSLVGERRMGKSTLLRAVNFAGERERFGIPESFHVAYVDMQYVGHCSEDELLEYVCLQLEEATGIPGEGAGRGRLKHLMRAARAQRLHVVLAIDEFDILLGNPAIPGDLFSLFRSLAGDFGLAYAIASREGSIEPLAAKHELGSSFLNIFATINVGPFDLPAARDLLIEPARREGVTFDDTEMKWAFALAGYHPFFLQIAAYHLFRLKFEDLAPTERLRQLRRDFLFEAKPHFDDLQSRLTVAEREAIAGLEAAESPPQGPVGRVVQSLVRRGILMEDRHVPGGARLFSLAFADFLAASEPPSSGSPMSSSGSTTFDSAVLFARAVARHIRMP